MTDTTLSTQDTSGLANLLESRLVEWENARKPQELKMLECYQDVLRIPREDDVRGTGASRTRKNTGLFIGSSRNKVRAARAKIVDALFGAGKMPFDTTPTNEEVAAYADVTEDIVTEQLVRMKFKAMLKTGVNTLATYGTGFIFGPFVRKEKIVETAVDSSQGFTQLKETEYEFDFPYFELGNTLDVYPDPEARDICEGLGAFWVTMESPHTVKAWDADPSYKNITRALNGGGDRGNETGSETASQMRSNVQYWYKNERIKVARFFGKIPKSKMPLPDDVDNSLTDIAEDADESGKMVDAIVIMAGGVVVKVTENPYNGKNPTLRCVYEAVEHEMWGVGVAENNAPHQKVTNAAFRLFMEGKGMALLGTSSVDRSKFLPTENFQKFPGKVYQMKPGLSPDEQKAAIVHHVEPDITGGWMDVIRMSEQFSDDDTGITKYTQGDDSSNLNKTATGISMIMSASSLPIKEVIQNIDEMWTEPIVECLIDWNLKYLDAETVRKIHGEEAAQKWQEIKDFGKSSFMDWQATGTSSFMQKEVLTNKIRAFSEFALGNPATAALIDTRELLQQTWDVMEIGRESPILEEDGEEGLSPQVKERMAQVAQQMEQLQQQLQEAQQAAQEAEQRAAGEEEKRIKAEIDAKEAKAMLNVEQAMTQAREDLRTEKDNIAPAPAPAPAAPAAPQMMVLDPNNQISDVLAPFAEMMAGSMQSTEAQINSLGQAVMQGNEQTAQMLAMVLAEVSKPRTATIDIKKQKDGSFAGTRTEQ